MDYQDVFERYEYKYFLTPSQKRKLLELSEGRLELDRYGRTTIRNIYYDTDSFRLIRDSLDHPVYKEKLRLRSYQKASDNDPVFIEIKKKFDDVVYKRRITMTMREAALYLSGADGRRYLLRFDCRKCEMQVINTEENKICPVTTPPTSISD